MDRDGDKSMKYLWTWRSPAPEWIAYYYPSDEICCKRCGTSRRIERYKNRRIKPGPARAFRQAHEKCVETRGRVAAAWDVSICSVRCLCAASSEHEMFIVIVDGFEHQFSPGKPSLWIRKYGGLCAAFYHDADKFLLHSNRTLPGLSGVARFLFCMGFDIDFLSELVTVSATQKIEWACEMRELGFPIEVKL